MDDFRLVIITGMSGAGKTQVCRHMEDLGYFCVDNLPPMFIPKFAELCAHSAGRVEKVALVVDIRSGEFFDTLVHVVDNMDRQGLTYEMVFMEASDATIIRRYKESRRRHPMAEGRLRITECIAKERSSLNLVRNRATYIIDTSDLQKTVLKEKIETWFGNQQEMNMNVTILSFGFKFGMPLDADMVFDVRFLPNPFYVDSLRKKSGAVQEVAEYIWKWPMTKQFSDKLEDMVEFLLPNFVREGKSQLVIAVGCTGGMHRSVFIARRLFDLVKSKGYAVNLEHRDLMKNDVAEHPQESV